MEEWAKIPATVCVNLAKTPSLFAMTKVMSLPQWHEVTKIMLKSIELTFCYWPDTYHNLQINSFKNSTMWFPGLFFFSKFAVIAQVHLWWKLLTSFILHNQWLTTFLPTVYYSHRFPGAVWQKQGCHILLTESDNENQTKKQQKKICLQILIARVLMFQLFLIHSWACFGLAYLDLNFLQIGSSFGLQQHWDRTGFWQLSDWFF